VLLAFDLAADRAEGLAGFAVACTPPDTPARLVALAVAKECWCCRRRPHGQSSEIMMVPAHTSSFFVIEHHHRNETQISGHPFTGNGSDLHPTGMMTKTNTSTIMIPIIIAHIHSLVASFGFIYYNNSLNMSPL